MGKRDPALHSGHRRRMKAQFRDSGLSHFNEHQIIELALFYAFPRGDTNELAHLLLKECGPRVCNVLDCSYSKLTSVKGIGENAATYITFLRELSAYYHSSKQLYNGGYFVNEISGVCRFYEGLFLGSLNEEIHAAAVSENLRLIREKKLADGTVGSVSFPMRKLMDFVLENKCDRVIIAHNHPKGNALASKDDFYATRDLVNDFKKFDIEIVDHIIVGENGSLSMRSTHFAGSIWKEE